MKRRFRFLSFPLFLSLGQKSCSLLIIRLHYYCGFEFGWVSGPHRLWKIRTLRPLGLSFLPLSLSRPFLGSGSSPPRLAHHRRPGLGSRPRSPARPSPDRCAPEAARDSARALAWKQRRPADKSGVRLPASRPRSPPSGPLPPRLAARSGAGPAGRPLLPAPRPPPTPQAFLLPSLQRGRGWGPGPAPSPHRPPAFPLTPPRPGGGGG